MSDESSTNEPTTNESNNPTPSGFSSWDDIPVPSEPESKESESNNEVESKETNTEPKESDKKPSETPKKDAPKMIKVGDQTIPESDLATLYCKWKGADQRFREAADAKKQTQAFLEALTKDPMKVLSDPRLPIDRKKLAETWLRSEIEKELSGEALDPNSPAAQRLAKLEQELTGYKQKEITEAQQRKQQEFQQHVEKRKTEISETLSKAMEASNLSKHPETAAATLREMALYMRAAKEQGHEVTPEQLAQHVENKRYKEYHSLVNHFDGEELVSFLGEELVNKIRKYDLGRLTKGREEQSSFKSEEPARSESKERKFLNPTDMRMNW